MYKKVIYFGFFMFLFFFSFISLSSANFMCGRVLSEDNYSTSWVKVNINYLDQPSKLASCIVSPDGFKYCCDTDDIKGVSYAKGKTVVSEFFDNSTGYFADKVSLITTGEGYDVFSDLIIKSAIKLNNPINNLIVGQNKVNLNFSVENPFNRIVISLNSYDIFSCTNCSNFDSIIENLTLGDNAVRIKVYDDRNRSIEKLINFISLDYLIFDRKFECNGCSDHYVYSGANEVNVTLTINSSHPIEGYLYDYYPISWLFIDSIQGESEIYSASHNKMNLFVNGSYAVLKYKLKPPSTYILKSYNFQSGFESVSNGFDKVFLYRFLKFGLFIQDYAMNRSFYKTDDFFKVSSSEPIVLTPKSNKIIQVAIFSKEEEKRVRVFFKEDEYKDSKQKFTAFFIDSNLPNNKLDKIMIDFKVNKSEVNLQNNSLSLYYVKKIKFLEKSNLTLTGEDELYYYFRSFSYNKGSYIILKEDK